jgi:hypothetical protein
MELYPNNWTGLYVNPYIAEAGVTGWRRQFPIEQTESLRLLVR